MHPPLQMAVSVLAQRSVASWFFFLLHRCCARFLKPWVAQARPCMVDACARTLLRPHWRHLHTKCLLRSWLAPFRTQGSTESGASMVLVPHCAPFSLPPPLPCSSSLLEDPPPSTHIPWHVCPGRCCCLCFFARYLKQDVAYSGESVVIPAGTCGRVLSTRVISISSDTPEIVSWRWRHSAWPVLLSRLDVVRDVAVSGTHVVQFSGSRVSSCTLLVVVVSSVLASLFCVGLRRWCGPAKRRHC